MNTKTFAQEARNILMEGVAKKLLYWGFDADGKALEQPEQVSGGYTFRGDAFDDANVPKLWNSLKNAIAQKGLEVVVEEAAYTWFNRMMAIRILAKNGYDLPQLEYAEGLNNTPVILQKARQGQYAFLNATEKTRLQKIIGDYNKETEAFALVLVGYCHSHNTLNKVFGKLDDYTELLLPDNMLQDEGFLHLLNTTGAISDDDYQKVELIGWLYQFYISERKDDVFKAFKKKKKAEAKDIPAATQIFTPNWIVKYMVENTAGKLWLDHKPDSPLKDQMNYLVDNSCHPELDSGSYSAGKVEETNENDLSPRAQSRGLTTQVSPLISNVEDISLIDPACGSGHILVEGFELLYQMYLEEYYPPEEAVQTIFEKNLYGLDIDNRATQLATFAVLLKAAKVYPDVWDKDWPLNIYPMPEANSFSWQEVADFLGEDGKNHIEELEKALALMQEAKNLGSIMQLGLSEETIAFIHQRYQDLQTDDYLDINLQTIVQKAQGFIPVLLTLTKKYTAVVANPPYMGQKSMNANLKNYLNTNYPISKSDLFAVFIEAMTNMLQDNARVGCITMESWMFLSSYEKLRHKILDNYSIASLAHFGWHIIGIAFGTATLILEKSMRIKKGEYSYLTIDDIDREKNIPYEFPKKDNGRYAVIPQTNFEKIPGSPIAYWVKPWEVEAFSCQKPFSEFANPSKGMMPGSSFLLFNWEVAKTNVSKSKTAEQSENDEKKWYRYFKGGSYRKWHGNQEYLVLFYRNGKILKENNYGERNPQYYFKRQINWSKIGSGKFSARDGMVGGLYDDAACQCPVNEEYDFEYLLAYLNSCVAEKLLQIIHNTLNYSPGEIAKIPTAYNSSDEVLVLANSCISISKKDWDSRETSWDFEQSPLLNESGSLEQAYQTWQEDVTQDFFQLHANEEELNRIFIDIYGLQDELGPEVALKEITILQDELSKKDLEALEGPFRENAAQPIALPIDKTEVMQQFISYAIGVFMGRYRLDKPGLNIAHPNPTAEELASYDSPFGGQGAITIDEDAIIPLMGTAANFKDDALYQIQELLDTIWGAATRTENLNFLQDSLNKDLEKYLVKDFWKYHCKMYKKKPIYWLFSSKKGAFQVLVYMHQMNAFTVEKIRANYLLEHLKYLNAEIEMLEGNQANLNTQESRNLDRLRKDLKECEDYDLHLKDAADRQITFDLDDGVKENHKLFKGVVAKIK